MSVTSMPTDVGATVEPAGSADALRLHHAVTVREAAAVRHAVRSFLDDADPAARLVIDLADVEELDAPGLAAVTSPVLHACRAGRIVSVLPPLAPGPRRLADLVGVLPIGPG
jgi:ABC-type transporter Mla MlaB component